MSNELTVVSPEVLTGSEQEQISRNIDSLIDRYKTNRQEINRLVLRAFRL